MTMQGYVKQSRLHSNEDITESSIPDPDNIPEPLGWTLKVRPYRINEKSRGGIIMAGSEVDVLNNVVNVGRVVAIGPCCWNRPHHKNADGEQFNWVEVGDFVSYPKHAGTTRKFKGVSIVTLNDDEIDERLLDPVIFGDDTVIKFDIPQEHLEKYNTIYNKEYMEKRNSK